VLQDHGIVQATLDGKAIWRVTVTSDSGWSHSFSVLKLAPALIWDAADRPATFAGTVSIENNQPSHGSELASAARDADTSTKVIDNTTASAPPPTDSHDTVAGPFHDLLDMFGTTPTPGPMPLPSTGHLSNASESTNGASFA